MGLSKKTSSILLLDDDASRKNINSSRLRVSVGTEVELALSGFHLVHLLEKNTYDLVLIFERPDDMPPEELISLIRINHPKEKLPIIYFSRKKLSSGSEADDNLDINEYVPLSEKFNFSQIVKAVEPYLK